jgi:hypothetical protein
MSANRPARDDRFEAAVQELLAERGRTTNGDVRAILDGLEDLPERSGGTRSWLGAVAALAVLAVAGALAFGHLRLPGIGNGADRVGRAAFADDPRLADCEAQNGTAAQVFEMTHAEWFPLYFPGWYRGAPELEVPDPALVVIGPPMNLPLLGGAPGIHASGPTATPHASFAMCIAIGAPGSASIHQYGPTWFDRIVPVLSDADVARAAHLDPDVLADPAAWPFPERLAPCGGLTGNELYIFEARLSELRLNFPHLTSEPFTEDDPVAVIVYRDRLPGVINDVGPSDVLRHDICIASELEGAQPDHVNLSGVDTTGFHVRIDRELAEPSGPPEPSVIPEHPQATPEPLPAWAGDAGASLECAGPPSTIGPSGPQTFDRSSGGDSATVGAYLGFVRSAGIPFPTDGFAERDRATGARLYTYDVAGRTKAVIVMRTNDGTETGVWRVEDVGSCDPSEYDPRTPVGGGIHVWTDQGGNPVRTDEVLQRDDCYGATKIAVRGRLYLKDPSGAAAAAEQLDGTYAADVKLPKDALWLGYLDETWAMWTAADGKALYIVDGNDDAHAERLPHVKGDEIERIDCN